MDTPDEAIIATLHIFYNNVTTDQALDHHHHHILYVPKTRLASYGDRAFSSCAPRLWNSLPDELRATPDLSTFKHNLKSHLFNLSAD